MRPVLFIFAMTTIFSVQSSSVLGHFKGTVLDVKGSKVKTARITVERNGFIRRLTSTKAGQFEIDLPPGTYRIVVEKFGFARFELTDLEIRPNEQAAFTFRLEPRNRQSSLPQREKCLTAAAEQSLAADGAIVFFSSDLFPQGRMLIALRS